ncbi:hypothetical protein PQX77_004881 [Marasmius sp. AFHP31]|nr:hypothetical protein PQX77_004881 [Marasmius sp. AFHP31]
MENNGDENPVFYPPDVNEYELGSPSSSISDPHILQGDTQAPDSKRGFRLPRPQSRLSRQPDKERDSSAAPQSTSRSRNSSRSVSALLLLTNERLNNATNRATTLQAEQDELVKRFGELYKEKLALQNELYSTQESLRLHKLQLELAQKQIDRANEMVHELDRQRTRADSNAAKLRGQVRTLEMEKLVRKGWDEGWDIGFKEGFDKAQREGKLSNRLSFRRRKQPSRTRSDRGGEFTDEGTVYDDDTTVPEDSTSSSSRRVRSNSTRSQQSGHAPRVAPQVPPLPVPPTTTSVPVQQPPQRPPSAPQPSRGRARTISSRLTDIRGRTSSNPSQPPQPKTSRRNTAPSSVRPPTETVTSPTSPEVIRPVPARRPSSPAASHRSRSTVPPDGFIPVGGDDGYFTLPPPHEMSVPVPPTTPPPPPPPANREVRSQNQGHVQGPRAPPPHGRETPRTQPMSEMSRASSRISHYDIVSPPRGGLLGLRVVNGDRNTRPPGGGDARNVNTSVTPDTPSGTTSSGSRVEQWRNEIANDPPDRQRTPAATPQSPPVPGSVPVTQQETAAAPPSRRSFFRPRTPRVSMIGPRRPNEIVMPTPLAPAANNILPQTREASPHPNQPTQARPARGVRTPAPTDQAAPRATEILRPAVPDAPSRNNVSDRNKPSLSFAWLKSRFQRSTSSPAPDIEVEPPSHSVTSVATNETAMDPLHLTPDDANRPIPLPNEVVSEATRGITLLTPSTPIPHTPITIQLPDEDLPLGFVPLTPMIRSPQLESSRSQSPRSGTPSRPSSPGRQSGFFSRIPSPDSVAQPWPPSLSSPPTRPATASGMTRPPLSTVPKADGVASRALAGPPGPPQDVQRSSSPVLNGVGEFGGWSPASHASFLRPPRSVFGEED